MRILIVHRLIAAFGGAHKYLVGLAERLTADGWEIHIAINPNPDIEPLLSRLVGIGIQIHPVDFDHDSPKALGDSFDKLINKLDPDVIDFETGAKSIRQLALNSSMFAATNAHKVFTMHLPIITDQSDLRGWKRHVPGSDAWQGIRERRKFLSLFDSGLSVSRFHSLDIARLIRLTRDFYTVIPNGVDTNEFHPAPPSHNQTLFPTKIVACGGLTSQKRFDLLISVGSILKEKNFSFRIEIAGEGIERAALERQIKRRNLADCVVLKGHVQDIPSFLRSGDIFVMCSDSEGLPYAALEAMSTGLPMVVTDAGELPHMIRDRKEGFVVNCGKVSGLVKSLSTLIEKPELRMQMGINSRARALQDFNASNNWQLVEKYYRGLKPGKSY